VRWARGDRAAPVARWAVLPALLLLALGLPWASAQSGAWTVQTVALRDLRQADTVVAQLRNLGFDAYDEFGMSDGKQFVRVRVGCYTDRAAAQAAATALAKHVTEQAVPTELSVGAKPDRCILEDVGFLKPAAWKRVEAANGLPTFRVRIAGRSADVVFDGAGWRVFQDGAARPVTAAVTGSASFVVAHPGGVPWVAEEVPSGTRLLCPGTLIGHAGQAAIVERAGEVVACSFAPRPSRLAAGKSP
jgi:hypothetical protein